MALVLRHSGLSYADVASALDLSPGDVGTTVRRGESTLRKELTRARTRRLLASGSQSRIWVLKSAGEVSHVLAGARSPSSR